MSAVPLEEEAKEPDWERDFAAAAQRPLRTRLRYAFVHTYKPVMDDAPYRSFSSLAEYRDWCARNLRPGRAMAPRFEYTQAEEIRDARARHGRPGSAAAAQGIPRLLAGAPELSACLDAAAGPRVR